MPAVLRVASLHDIGKAENCQVGPGWHGKANSCQHIGMPLPLNAHTNHNRHTISDVKIGIYDGEWCGAFHLAVALKCMGIPYCIFGDMDVLRPGFGEEFTIMMFGTGGIFDCESALGGSSGMQRIRDLIADGRCYIGICAGSYLAIYDQPKGLGLAQCSLDHPESPNIFQGFLDMTWRDDTESLFPVWYQNGPVFSHAQGEAIAYFSATQRADTKSWSSTSPLIVSDFQDRPAVIRSQFGRGQCILFSPHLELGTLGTPEYNAITGGWMREHYPNDPGARPTTAIMTDEFLQEVGQFGLPAQTRQPQWSMLKHSILSAL